MFKRLIFTGLKSHLKLASTVLLASASNVSLAAASAAISQMTLAEKMKLATMAIKQQSLAWLASPIGAITAVIAALALAAKAWDAYAGAKEKAAKEKIEEYDGIFLV